MAQDILDHLRRGLTRPRELDVRMAARVCDQMGGNEPLAALTSPAMARLEDFEVELLLSPLFTPTQAEREPFEESLPRQGVDESDLADMVALLVAESLNCLIIHGKDEGAITLPEVIISRYVRLLRLSHSVCDVAVETVASFEEASDRWRFLSLARQPVWHRGENGDLLDDLLPQMGGRPDEQVEKMEFLTEFVNSYRPRNLAHLAEQLLHLVESYRIDGEKPIYNQNLEENQNLAIRSSQCGEQVKAHRLAMAHGLLADFRVQAADFS